MPAPAPFPPATRVRGFGNPSALRCFFDKGFSGGGLGKGEDKGDNEDSEVNPEGESPGVSASGSTMLTSTSASLSSSGDCSGGAMSCDKREGDGFRLRALLDTVSEVSEREDADDSSNVRFGDLNGLGSRSEFMFGTVGYGGGVVRDDEGASEESLGEGERESGSGTCVGADGVGEVAVIFTGFETDLRSLRLVGVVTLEGCLVGGFCFPLWGGGEGGPESPERSTTFGIPVWGPLRLRIDEKCSQSW